MKSSWRLSALLFASVKAEEIALIQDVKKTTKVARKTEKGAAMASLMESAKGFLKNGATTDVVEFADATLEEISSIVIPAIVNASKTDQLWLDHTWSTFQSVKDDLTLRNQEVFMLNAEEQAASSSHKVCRSIALGGEASQEQKCEDKRDCEMQLYRHWVDWAAEEAECRRIQDQIEDHVCPPDANGTLHSFRVTSIPLMNNYMACVNRVAEEEDDYDLFRPQCIVAHDALETRSVECNAHQATLEDRACAHAISIRDSLQMFHTAYDEATLEYIRVVAVVQEEEKDRHREFVTLQVVDCLLNRVHELNGRPCDEATGVSTEVAHCEERHQLAVCIEKPEICMTYPPIPPQPPTCAARHQVIFSTELYPAASGVDTTSGFCVPYTLDEQEADGVEPFGRRTHDAFTCAIPAQHADGTNTLYSPAGYTGGECLPVVQPWPCNADFDSQEYAALPALPVDPFTAVNPGCNAYPECSVCQEMMPTTTTTTTTTVTYDSRLTAYWEFGNCGAHGNDHNWDWCGRQAGTCPQTVAVDSSICASGEATRALWTPRVSTATETALTVGTCEFIYHAQYVCA